MWVFFPTSKTRGLSCHRLLCIVGLIPLRGKIVASGAVFPFPCHCFPSEIQMEYPRPLHHPWGFPFLLVSMSVALLISDSSNILRLFSFLPVGH